MVYKTRKDLDRKMDFKSLSYKMTEEEYIKFCGECLVPFERETNLCKSNLKLILENLKTERGRLTDIGCGNGYLLEKIREVNPNLELCGVDVQQDKNFTDIAFKNGNIAKLDFADNQFDIVTCTHTIEHIINVEDAFSELIRITKRKLIIVVPCQRYFYYTLDGHIQFFYKEAELLRYLPFKNFTLNKLDGDWIYIGEK
jgi:SAM-dependent methyltransferase